MTERSRRITTFIFLLSVFVFLAVMTFVWSYRFYQTGRIQTTTVSKSAVECGGYAFRVVGSTMNYVNKTLSLQIEYVGGRFMREEQKLKRLSVIVNGKITPSEEINPIIESPFIKINNVEINDTFLIAPEGCEEFNVKSCSLSTKKCIVP